MKRRQFTFGLAALTAAPALPLAAAARQGADLSVYMKNAGIIARAHNRCTVDMLMRHLKVTPSAAGQIQAALLRQGVITAPVAGVSMAANPTNSLCITNEALRPTNMPERLRAIKDLAQKALEADPKPDAPSDGEVEPDNHPA